MFDYGFIDFDDTLFRTDAFKEDMFGCFARCGVSRANYALSYSQAVFGPVVGYFDYTFEKHANVLRDLGYQIPDTTVDELNLLFEKNYNNPEAEKFLSDCRKFTNKLILLSAGESNFQNKKINNSGLVKYFDEIIIIDGGKGAKIESIIDGAKKIYYINDNLKENIDIKKHLPHILLVALKHQTQWEGEDYRKYNLPFFNSLEEIKNYVEKSI